MFLLLSGTGWRGNLIAIPRFSSYYHIAVNPSRLLSTFSYSYDLSGYLLFRYGSIFKTSLVGRPVIVSTDADLNYFIFQQEGKLFQSWYPDTFTEIFGRQNVGSLHGFMYKYLKNLVLNLFGPESLKKMLPEVEQASKMNLKRWSGQTVDVKDATAQVIGNTSPPHLVPPMFLLHIPIIFYRHVLPPDDISPDCKEANQLWFRKIPWESEEKFWSIHTGINLLSSGHSWNSLPQMLTGMSISTVQIV